MRLGKPLFAAVVAGLLGSAAAQYKIVGPDGRVTYTDRPPASAGDKVVNLGRSQPAAATPGSSLAALPLELRQAVARYPVTLYTGSGCQPCEAARQLLRERGIPYSERQVLTEEDTAALERLSGGRTIPTLAVGAQMLRGFNPSDWATYLDAADYPRESRLPRGWQPPPVAPIVARAPAVAPSAPLAPAPARAPAAPAPAGDTPGSSIRF